MFKFLRSKAKIFYWVIAASFILFIFLAWGMDLSGGRGARTGRGDVIGSVNGYAISYTEWDRALQSFTAQQRRQNQDRPLTANQLAQARQQVWDQLVRDRIVQAEVDRLGLEASDREILDVLKNDPPPELLANYEDEQGVPDLAAYHADLANPNRDWTGVENYLRVMLPRQKLQQMIMSQAVVTDAELRDAFRSQSVRAVAEYLGVFFADLADDHEPSEAEIAAYHEAHAGLFERPARATVQAVVWPKVPSETDRLDVLQLARDIKREIERGDYSFEDAAEIYSQDATAQNGGDLGTFGRDRMVAPFTEAAFSLPVGQISDPVETEYGFHLIEVLERIPAGEGDGEGGGDEAGQDGEKVHARHILLKVEPAEETLADLYAEAAEWLDTVTPATFVGRARADSLELLEPGAVSEGQNIPGLRNSMDGANFAVRAKPGTISPILGNDEAYYAVLIQEKHPAGPAPLEEVRSQIVYRLQREHKRELARQELAPAVGALQEGRSFAEAAAEFGLAHAVTDTFTATANIPDIGYGTAFNEVAIEVEPGTLVPEVETRRGLFALRTLWREAFDEEAFLAQKQALRIRLLSLKQQELMEAWFEEKLAEAKIVDNRNDRLQG